MKISSRMVIVMIILALIAIVATGFSILTLNLVQQTTQQIVSPVQQANQQIQTQVSQILNPTPTIIPDPITIIHEIRSLARLETIQYTVEKVITAELGQGQFGFLFGDKLLFVARGVVIAGVDLSRLKSQDLWLEESVLYIRLPEPEVFVATLDNDKSYVYDRETGLLSKGDKNLESQARQVAEEQIRKAALEDGILEQARANAESYLYRLFHWLGYKDVIFLYSTPQPNQ